MHIRSMGFQVIYKKVCNVCAYFVCGRVHTKHVCAYVVMMCVRVCVDFVYERVYTGHMCACATYETPCIRIRVFQVCVYV
jgi:hypothetical protein